MKALSKFAETVMCGVASTIFFLFFAAVLFAVIPFLPLFWLAATVKKSLKLLGEQDKLGVAEADLLVKKEDLDPTDKGDQNKIEKLQEELDDLTEELEGLKTQFSELWDLTPRSV